MISFQIARHSFRKAQVIEIWHDGAFIASLYGMDDERGIKLVSDYLPFEDPIQAGILLTNPGFAPSLEIRFAQEKRTRP